MPALNPCSFPSKSLCKAEYMTSSLRSPSVIFLSRHNVLSKLLIHYYSQFRKWNCWWFPGAWTAAATAEGKQTHFHSSLYRTVSHRQEEVEEKGKYERRLQAAALPAVESLCILFFEGKCQQLQLD